MTEEHGDKEQATRPTHHPKDDEIDLAQLVGVLFRRWSWILGCTLLAVLIGVGYSLTLPSLYSFTSMVQIGQYQTPEKEYKFIQSPKAAAQQLTFIPGLTRAQRSMKMTGADPGESASLGFI